MMVTNDLKLPLDSYIIPAELAIKAMRDSGYRNTAYALAELIDNAAQAKASLIEVFCLEETQLVNQRKRRRIQAIAVLDNGTGMGPALLRRALQFGYGTHLNDRSGIGRFGIGLPNASISQGRCVRIWTWQNGPDNAVTTYLDVDEIDAKKMTHVPEPIPDPVPEEFRRLSKGLGTTGTLVIWSKFDEERLTWKGSKATLENTESIVGRMYRKFIDKGDLRIRLCAIDSTGIVYDVDARVNDPLYLMAPSSTPVPFNDKPMFQRYGERDQTFEIEFRGETHEVVVRASYARPETVPQEGTERGARDYGKHAAKNVGLSIVRAGRELDLDNSWTISYDPRERWWGMEVEFPPALDEIFGVTNNKQAATNFSHMAGFDWKTEAESNEEYLAYKRRLTDDGDHRVYLIDIVDYIRTTLPKLRELLEDQTKGRRGRSKRHDDTSVDDRASTKFKERAKSGHETPADKEVFTDQAKDELVKDLVREKNYEESDAKDIAEAVFRRKRTVIFVDVSNEEIDAFFYVEQKPGGITEIVINRAHPAYEQLIKTLDSDTTNATDKDLVARIQNASETLKMLFAAWARHEIEDIPNRNQIRNMRGNWGRMTRDFLTDKQEG